MSLAVSFSGECEVTDDANKGPFSVVSTQMTDECGFIRAGVGAEVTLVSSETKVTSNMTCYKESNIYIKIFSYE